MPQRQANQIRYCFACGDLDPSTVEVAHFSGTDEISQPYVFSILLKSQKSSISSLECIGKQATLFIERDEQYYGYSGIVQEFEYRETTVDYSTYHVVLVPRLSELELNIQSRVFQKMKIPEIVALVLQKAGLSDYYQFDVQENYPVKELVIQYQESDLNFIQRLMEESGIWYFFKEQPVGLSEATSPKKETMVISDNPASFMPINGETSLPFKDISGVNPQDGEQLKESVTTLVSHAAIIPQSVRIKNYNYRTPEVDLSTEKKVEEGLKGKVYHYGNEARQMDEITHLAQISSDRIAAGGAEFKGRSDCAGLRAGMRYTLTGHLRQECNDTMLLQQVTHEGSHPTRGVVTTAISYANTFSALPSALIKHFRPKLRSAVPKVPGILTATIEATGKDYATVDEQGRYKVRLPFDISDSANFNASKYVRLAQPYSGSNYGIHFPSHAGTEMILACVDGNPNKIMGIGTVPNSDTVSPVVSKNRVESVIRTAGRNEMIMDDTKGNEKVKIYTPYDYFETAGHNQTISIENDREKVVGHDETNHILNDRRITVDGKHIETIQSDTRIHITEGNLDHDVVRGDVRIHVGGTHKSHVEGDVVEKYSSSQQTTVQKEITIRSVGSTIHLNAAEEIELKTGLSSILLKSDGTIEISGLRIAIKGMGIAVNGTESIRFKGGSIASEALVDHTTKGQIVLSSGTVTNTLKGTMVMLNP